MNRRAWRAGYSPLGHKELNTTEQLTLYMNKNKDLLSIIGNSVQKLIITYNGYNRKKNLTSLCCTPEVNTVL